LYASPPFGPLPYIARAAPAADLIVRYAELLAANGRLGMALEYLQMIPGGWVIAVIGRQAG
jgi:hypothetical protein